MAVGVEVRVLIKHVNKARISSSFNAKSCCQVDERAIDLLTITSDLMVEIVIAISNATRKVAFSCLRIMKGNLRREYAHLHRNKDNQKLYAT